MIMLLSDVFIFVSEDKVSGGRNIGISLILLPPPYITSQSLLSCFVTDISENQFNQIITHLTFY